MYQGCRHEAESEKVTDLEQILKFKLLATSGLLINERVVCAGRIPTLAEATRLIDAMATKG